MTETQKTKTQEQISEEENIVFIGEKPFMNYVNAVVTQFKEQNQQEVIVKARGKFISRAVDVSEVAAKRFLKELNISVKDIKINSEEFENKEAKRVNVSIIEITLEKQE
jgi:archaea-specific DNA-binding protein